MPPEPMTGGNAALTADQLAALETKAVMDAATRNKLSDADFAYVDSNGGRHLPVNDAAHARAALSRFDQTQFESDAAKAKARAAILAACKKFGIDVSADAMKSPPLDEDEFEIKADDLPDREYKSIPFEFTPADDLEPNCFKGHGGVIGNVDTTGDIIAPGFFAGAAPSFLAKGTICWQHQWEEPIGKPLEASEDGKGLYLKARISETVRGKDALTLMRDGVVKTLSIGYKPTKARWLSDKEGTAMLGAEGYKSAIDNLPLNRTKIRVLEAGKVFEVSPVTVAANDQATITGIKGLAPAAMTYEDHFSAVLTANEELLERTRAIADLRFKSGRMLSAVNVAKLGTMRDSLSAHSEMLGSMLETQAPKSAEPDDDAETKAAERAEAIRHELALYLEREARLSGALAS